MKKFSIILIAFCVIYGCGNNAPYDTKDKVIESDIVLEEPPMANNAVGGSATPPSPKVDQMKFPPPMVSPDQKAINSAAVSKKVIKDGNISFESANIDTTRKSIYRKLKRLGGYVSNEQETNNTDANEKTYTISAHVPAKNFDAFLNGVAETAVKIDSKNISTRDLTTEYIDMTTRLANKKKLEERYLELLKKGSKIADLLEIENKLTEIRTDIESSQGQLNYLNKQIDYSTLEITFYTKQTVKENGATFGYRIKNSIINGWEGLVSLFFGFISYWHYWLVLALIIIIFRRWRANVRRENKNN